MLAPRRAAGTELGADGEGHGGPAAGHEGELRRLVEELVEADADEVEVHQLDHRSQAGHRGADAEADDRRLGDGGVADPVAEPLAQAPGQPEHVAALADVDAGEEDALVALELDRERVTDRVHRAELGRTGGRRRGFGVGRAFVHHVVRERPGVGCRRPPGGVERLVERAPDRGLERLHLPVGDTGSAQPARVHEQRVAPGPLGDLFLGAVALRVALVVPVVPVGERLDDRRPLARARPLDRPGRRGRDRHHVVPVHRRVGDAVAGRAAFERCGVLGRCGRELGVPVVLAEEDDRQPPDRGEVDRLVERARGDRAVAEERDRDRAVAAQACGPRGTDGDRQACGDDPVRAEDADPGIRDVHRAAAAAVGAVGAREQLGEHRERVESLGEAVPVPAVRRRDHVGRAQRPARADGGRLLADGQVHEAGHLACAVAGCDPLLEPAHDQHPPVHLEEVGAGEHGRSTVLVGTRIGAVHGRHRDPGLVPRRR
ncbi:MAG: hypothetical protein KatS3mg009_1029 [Acidimicrobiia bacterium]|nr:MAG: hypothetical protein KatS3mg009_1029 [Acidimicrobiia bacterium]